MIWKYIQHIFQGKSFVAERFIRIMKNKTWNYMTVVSKNVYIDKLNNILNQSRQNLLMLRQVYWFYVRNNDKDAKFKVTK